ncbi:DUF2971 domain-containing protein [Hydrogenophaga sp. RWCD_12]|uniref:DUF2971 domain-containing protein n=1 Tax=Hydrogenophaga sp. RWCD_12 TaxID=3391190 RepID=UPI003984B4E4
MSSSAGRLYRILSFDRAVQIFEKGELHFAHPSTWEDPYEVRLKHNQSHQLFGQCWCTKGVSDAMWRIYSPNHLGVRISTSTAVLRRQLASVAKERGYALRMEPVQYASQYKINKEFVALRDDLQRQFSASRAMDALFLKREAFDHESEYRVLLNVPEANRKMGREGLKIPINAHRLIDSVLLDPRAPDELVAAFTYYLQQKIGFKKRVARSVLYKSNEPYLVEGE